MRLLICGSRNWTDEAPIRVALVAIPPGVLLHGDCNGRNGVPGADRLAGSIGRAMGWSVVPYPAAWREHVIGWCQCGRPTRGKPRPPYCSGAGPRRNQRMLDEGKPDRVFAFPLPGSVGTWDMVRRARKAGVPVDVYGAQGEPYQ